MKLMVCSLIHRPIFPSSSFSLKSSPSQFVAPSPIFSTTYHLISGQKFGGLIQSCRSPGGRRGALRAMASDSSATFKPFGVLFVCLGNICRSPTAEAVFCDAVHKRGLASAFKIDSAGTIDYHEGNPADPRMKNAAKKRGIEIASISTNNQSWRFIANTFYDLEADFVEYFQKRGSCIMRTIGPLLPPEAFRDPPSRIAPLVEIGVNTESDECLDWLDKQEEESVLYISFGSENSISSAQTEELAMGLEASKVKFVWVLRIPSDAGSESFSSALDFLPKGFSSRMVEEERQGFIIVGWAPQLSILAHPATGGFVSHSGWNAVVETMTMGVPMISWPLFADQHYNSKFVVDEIQIALEAPKRAEQNWLVPRDDVERIVKVLMMEEKGRELRKRVREMKMAARAAVAEGGSSYSNFDLLVSEIMSLQSL